MFDPFNLPYFQEGLAEILLLSVAAGLIGSWVVLRGLSFYSHAIGTASFPGLVLADGLGFSAAIGAFGMAAVFTGIAALLSRSRRSGTDSATALALVACLAAGVILASDVFGSGANVDTLLFGSLLAIDSTDLWLAGGAAVLALLASRLFGHHWLAKGFDEGAAPGLRSGSAWFDALLLGSVAVTVTATLSAVGALLVAALMVVPAATVRLFASRLTTLQAGSIVLVALEGTLGLWLSVPTDAPPGATIAVVSGAVFAVALGVRALGRRRPGLRPVAITAALIALAGLGTGCGAGSSKGDRIEIVATTTQVADLASEVGGDRIELTRILDPNTDPHEYEPRPSDVQAVAGADVVFRSGGHLDDWTQGLIDDSGSDARVVDLSEGLPLELTDDDGEPDPHWWQDPVNVRAAVVRMSRPLAETDPAGSRYFSNRARRFGNEIGQVKREIESCLRSVPGPDRKIVTDHDAFGYFTYRFGIETVGTVIPALTTEAQASAGDLAELEKTIRRERVKAVFPEASVSPGLAEAVARDTGASTDYTLYGDTLGPEGSPGETWLGMIKSNADSLIRGMTGGKRGCFAGAGDG